jgi:pimeloyl-ACP methyl ester carboxylesterase
MIGSTATKYFAGLAGDQFGADDDLAPLVLLHGLTFDRTNWRPALEHVARSTPDRRILSLDLPGHGETPRQSSYRLETVASQVHAAVADAGITSPVIVGHSAGAIVATMYAAMFPVRGVVNVDQPLQTAAFAELLQSLRVELRGPDYRRVWDMFTTGFRIDLLPATAQDLLRSTTTPDQALLLGYWSDLLEPALDCPEELLEHHLVKLAAEGRPYEVVVGDPVDVKYAAWLAGALPQSTVRVIPRGGHFPHLADPRRFAALLTATAGWPELAQSSGQRSGSAAEACNSQREESDAG